MAPGLVPFTRTESVVWVRHKDPLTCHRLVGDMGVIALRVVELDALAHLEPWVLKEGATL